MTKKHFQALARALYEAAQLGAYEIRDAASTDPYYRGMCDANVRNWEAVAVALAKLNPCFDRALFLEACETGKCKGMRS